MGSLQGSGSRVQGGSGFRVQGPGFREVQGSGSCGVMEVGTGQSASAG